MSPLTSARQTTNNNQSNIGNTTTMKISVTDTFVSKSFTNPVAKTLKVGRKSINLDKTSADDIATLFTGKFETTIEDLRGIATYLLFRTKKNEYSRLRTERSDFKAWWEGKNPKKDYSAYKATLTRRVKANKTAYDSVVAVAMAMKSA